MGSLISRASNTNMIACRGVCQMWLCSLTACIATRHIINKPTCRRKEPWKPQKQDDLKRTLMTTSGQLLDSSFALALN
jgi:hypothetical protein